MGIPCGYVLRVVNPLYIIPESGLHWYLTYLHHHLDFLGMKRTRADPCVLMHHTDNCLVGLVLLQVEYLLGFGTEDFLEQKNSLKRVSKQATHTDWQEPHHVQRTYDRHRCRRTP